MPEGKSDNSDIREGKLKKLTRRKQALSTQPETIIGLNYPRVDNDLIMFAASFKRSPSAPELFCLVNLILLDFSKS